MTASTEIGATLREDWLSWRTATARPHGMASHAMDGLDEAFATTRNLPSRTGNLSRSGNDRMVNPGNALQESLTWFTSLVQRRLVWVCSG